MKAAVAEPSRRALVFAVALTLACACFASRAAAHPFHVSISEIDHNAEAGVLEVALRLHPSDLEEALSFRAGERVNLDTTEGVDAMIVAYLGETFVVEDETGARGEIRWVGKDIELDWGWLYFEVPAPPGRLRLFVGVLHDTEPGQDNAVMLRLGGRRVAQRFGVADEPIEVDIAAGVVAPRAAEAGGVLAPLAHVERRGDGETAMLLIPGVADGWSRFERFMDRNAQRYTMAAVTLPGFAGSGPPPGSAGDWLDGAWLASAEAALQELLEAEAPRGAVVVGEGLGAQLAFRLAVAPPERVLAVVAIDGFHTAPLGGEIGVSRHVRREIVEGLAARAAQASDRAWLRAKQNEAISAAAEGGARALAETRLRTPRGVWTRYELEGLMGDLRADIERVKPRTLVVAPVSGGAPLDPMSPDERRVWRSAYGDDPGVEIVFVEAPRGSALARKGALIDQVIADFLGAR